MKTQLIILAFLLSSCQADGKFTRNYGESVGVSEAIHLLEALGGTDVRIKGYLTFGDDKHNLWTSKDSYYFVKSNGYDAKFVSENCITIFNYNIHRKQLINLDKKIVVVKGVISKIERSEGAINLGSCNVIGVSISYIE